MITLDFQFNLHWGIFQMIWQILSLGSYSYPVEKNLRIIPDTSVSQYTVEKHTVSATYWNKSTRDNLTSSRRWLIPLFVTQYILGLLLVLCRDAVTFVELSWSLITSSWHRDIFLSDRSWYSLFFGSWLTNIPNKSIKASKWCLKVNAT